MSKGGDTKDLKEQYDFILESVSGKLDQQIEKLGALDTKSSIVFAVAGILFAGLLQIVQNDSLDRLYLVIVEALLLIGSCFYTFRVFILSKKEIWRNDPRPSKLINTFSKNYKKGIYWLKLEVIKSISASYEKNDILFNQKYRWLRTAVWLLVAAIIILLIHIVLEMYEIPVIDLNFKF
ncbi:hypothetical protein JW887_03170 [Candidatus Dojkabacteria bacterium]|nr:hypothetical protein [Candidatus Dojkabacteria bacterium]